ncbi:alanine racemase [Evansella cellulosilytica]|uniref:Alanine racemase n=1 Tax=Evansella cellulosilytica (strain ATCC 21833 / DSM 2522 / FERM P-1141 / JCM 9156 / N-4) TaxID=649639 RepID=E6TV42_EVAC2|nr:alanine racemase [Evansella cellulosilytica]ADU28625.1 alanine racemase [Evansella cellulosilytica DSM 2522]
MNSTNHFYRNTWVEVDLNAIRENVKNLKNHLPSHVHIMAAVKANGYGHSSVPVAEAALQAGATYLGVALLDEAIELRENGIKAPILVLGYVSPKYVNVAAEYDIRLTVFQSEWVEEAAKVLEADNKGKIACHVKIDTGMGRLGIRTKEEGNALIVKLKKYSLFTIEGLFTHYATADELDTSYLELQQQRFKDMISWFEATWGAEVPMKHCGNSATALRFSSEYYNLVRYGISMYGLSPSEEIKELLPFPLKQAFSLYSEITHIKKAEKGDGISYGATYKSPGEEWIGTIPIGYADGWIRANATGEVLVNGERVPIVGRICMDQMMVALKQPVQIGTKVTIIGKQGNSFITIDEVANRLNTINYEIPCTIGSRVPRIMVDKK